MFYIDGGYNMFQHKFLLLGLILLNVPNAAFAQIETDRANANNQNVIQQYEQERRQEELNRKISREQKALNTDIQTQKQSIPQSGNCINVNAIELQGATIFEDSDYNKITGQYANRCLYISDINDLTQDLSNLYIDRGYISSRAYIPEQDLSSGVLKLFIVEGRLEQILYQPSNGKGEYREITTAFGDIQGDVLNLRDVEQGMDQMNRLESNEVTMELMPGTQTGGTVILLKNQRSKPWHVKTGVDNYGSASTGEVQGFVELGYDNLFSANDLISFSFKHDLEQANRRQSKNVYGRYEVPYGPYNFSYSLSYFDYISQISTLTNDFKTEGYSRTHDLSVARVLYRDQKSKTNANISFVSKENENFLSGFKLSNSSQKLTILKGGLSHSRQISNGFLFGALNINQGVGWLGAQEDDGLSPASPQAEFTSVTADLNAIKFWDWGWGAYNPRTDLVARGQWSSDQLFGSEQISAGGPFSVRGFKSASLSGDTGAYGRFDFSIPFKTFKGVQTQKYIGTIVPYAGFDAGVIKSDKQNPFEGGQVKSWTLGLKNQSAAIDFDVSYSRAISSPAFLEEDSGELYFRASIKF